MQILLDADCLIQASKNIADSAVLSLCRQKRCQGWVASTSIPAIWQEAGARNVQSILQDLAVLTPTAHDIDLALGSKKPFTQALATRLVEASGLDAVGCRESILPDRGCLTMADRCLPKDRLGSGGTVRLSVELPR